jgi:hypothetical protein
MEKLVLPQTPPGWPSILTDPDILRLLIQNDIDLR